MIKKININTATDKELKHPYLTWNQVNTLIAYRKQHGNFKNIEEIKNVGTIDADTFRKIAPYLTVQ